jgi:hypothetical protein
VDGQESGGPGAAGLACETLSRRPLIPLATRATQHHGKALEPLTWPGGRLDLEPRACRMGEEEVTGTPARHSTVPRSDYGLDTSSCVRLLPLTAATSSTTANTPTSTFNGYANTVGLTAAAARPTARSPC